MKIACLSDTHHYLLDDIKIPYQGDIFIHAGDANLSNRPRIDDFLDEMQDIRSAYEFLIYVPGNHDIWIERHPEEAKELFRDAGVILLINEMIVIKSDGEPDVRILGVPYVPQFRDWAFMRPTEMLNKMWTELPACDILISHGPPSRCLDRNILGSFCGSAAQREYIVRHSPKLAIFGHIHEEGGMQQYVNNTPCYNVSVLDERYVIKRGAREIQYENSKSERS